MNFEPNVRAMQYVRADEVKVGDILMERIQAFDPDIFREEGVVDDTLKLARDGNIWIHWKTPYGYGDGITLLPHVQVAVIR